MSAFDLMRVGTVAVAPCSIQRPEIEHQVLYLSSYQTNCSMHVDEADPRSTAENTGIPRGRAIFRISAYQDTSRWAFFIIAFKAYVPSSTHLKVS
jgi:hypothetical protein